MELDEIKARNQHLRVDLERIFGEKDAEIAALQASIDTIMARIQTCVSSAKDLMKETTVAKIREGIREVVAFIEAPEKNRKKAEIDAMIANLQQQKIDLDK